MGPWGFLERKSWKLYLKGIETLGKEEDNLREKRCCYLFFFEFSYFSWGLFLSLLYIIGEREFFLTMYLFWGRPFIYIYIVFVSWSLSLEVCIVRIDLGPYSSKLFLSHLFICIMILFFLRFLRFILFYIYYIYDHFGIWIFYPFLLFSSLPI